MTEELKERHQHVEQAYRKACADDPLGFILGLKIPSAVGPKWLANCVADYQRQCFEALEESLIAVRNGTMPPTRRYWWERTKKASKDADLGAALLWLVSYPRRPLYIQVGAADKDQAAIIKRRITDLLYYNPWLEELVDVSRYRILSRTGPAEIDIIAADIAGSHGETPDVLVVNELSHVTKWEFVENLMDNAAGVPQGLVIVATNAGFKNSKAWKIREDCRKSDEWFFHVMDRPAPWLSEVDIKEAKQRNTKSRYERLFWGRWASGVGDALDPDDIEQCFKSGLKELTSPEKGWRYIAGLDLGVSHDHAGLVVVGIHESRQDLRVAWMRGWAPNPKTGEVDLIEVEDTCYALCQTFGLSWLGYDPTQAKLMAQRLTRKGVPMQEVTFASAKNLTAMAEALRQTVASGVLHCYEDDEGRLRRDFGKFNIVDRGYGYKLESVSDEFGHADVGTALAICLPRAVTIMSGNIFSAGDDDVIFDNEDDERETVEGMPDELREIYEGEEEHYDD